LFIKKVLLFSIDFYKKFTILYIALFLFNIFLIMLEFFYKSLETLKEVKKPTKDEVIKMTIIVIVIILISAILF